jgi:hypothetical protein
VLPEGLEFKFDQSDSEDDLLRETIREKSIANIRKLWEPTIGGPGIVSTAEARRLLVEAQAVPDWLDFNTDSTTINGDANVPEDESALELVDVPEAVQEGVPQTALEDMAAKARLAPGEDLVTVNARGDVRTLWSSRRSFLVANWPRPALPTADIAPLVDALHAATKAVLDERTPEPG